MLVNEKPQGKNQYDNLGEMGENIKMYLRV
jgi:hypothetical protein